MSVRRPLIGLVIQGLLLSACSTSATPPPSAGPTEAAPTIAATITWPPARVMSLSAVLLVARLGQPDP